jgi:hypothetical protein
MGLFKETVLRTHDWLIDWLIMSMGWDYVSELRSPPGDTQARWNIIDSEKLLTHQQELSGNHTNSHLLAKQEEMEKETINFALRSISFILLCLFNMPNLATAGFRKVCCNFYRTWPSLKTRIFGPMASTLTIRPPRTTAENSPSITNQISIWKLKEVLCKDTLLKF